MAAGVHREGRNDDYGNGVTIIFLFYVFSAILQRVRKAAGGDGHTRRVRPRQEKGKGFTSKRTRRSDNMQV